MDFADENLGLRDLEAFFLFLQMGKDWGWPDI
jgi:hypothetical protein